MVAVSGLLYRMKQNAVGLASITILATMVLVMISSTVSMYAGIGDTIKRQYTHQISMSASYDTNERENVAIPTADLLDIVQETAAEFQLALSFAEEQRYFACAMLENGDGFWENRGTSLLNDNVMECWFITAEEYEKLTGEKISLAENEIAVYEMPDNAGEMPNSFQIGDRSFTCLTGLERYPINMEEYKIVDCVGCVVSDEAVLQDIYTMQREAYGEYASKLTSNLVIDFEDEQAVSDCYDDFTAKLRQNMNQYVDAKPDSVGGYHMRVDSKWDEIEYLYGMNGTFLFLGLILSIIFLFATALIIYYKQISEGYEDRSRFHIMQKVGMSADEAKAAIRSQILLVFFLPLIVAGIHIAFAFPILIRLLKVLFLSDQSLFLLCTAASLGAFALIYVLIYGITAKIYYQIVSGS
jgi:putative ABC transport system permease protein